MKWSVHEHDLYDRSLSQHTEEQLLVYSFLPFPPLQSHSLLLCFFPFFLTSTLFFSPANVSVLYLLSSCPFSLFLQHNSLQFVLIWQTVSVRAFLLPLFYRGIISRCALWRKAPHFISYSLLLPQFLHQYFLTDNAVHFFFLSLYKPSTFAIQYQPPTFSLRQ